MKPVIQNENCSVLMLNDATGEGVMAVYRVMPGVMICFSDMHMEQCASEFELKNDRKIFCIDHCREGRIEMEVKPGVFSIMQENELRLDNRENHKGDNLLSAEALSRSQYFHGSCGSSEGT